MANNTHAHQHLKITIFKIKDGGRPVFRNADLEITISPQRFNYCNQVWQDHTQAGCELE